jgi:Ca2+-binding EF-hand superfamily protein
MAAVRDSEEAVKEFKESFSFFDGDRDGYLTSHEFSEVIRALGYAPTETELSALQRTIDRIYSGRTSCCACCFVAC